MSKLEISGIKDIIKFTEYLRKKNLWYRLDQFADDYITVKIDIVNNRVEVDFYVDRVEYNYFQGHEDIKTDMAELLSMLASALED